MSYAGDSGVEKGRESPGRREARRAGSRISDQQQGHFVLAYLGKHGLVPGRLLEVKEVRDLDGVVTVEDEDGTPHSLGKLLDTSILVWSTPEGSR